MIATGQAGSRTNRITVFGAVLAVMFFYTIAFPKGGIKVAGIPLTIGYAFTAAMLVLAMMRGRGLALPVDRLLALFPCLLLGLWSAIVIQINGMGSLGGTVSYFVTVLYIPFFGMIAFSSLLMDDHRRLIERTFVWAVRFIVCYGIFLFVFRQVTGTWIEIPLLTVNVADVGQLDDKYISRGAFFKLISTYNNGNVFGVSVLTLAPLYLFLENRKLLRGALYVALFLTLARTVWIGIALLLALRSLARGVKPSSVLYLLVSMAVGVVLMSVMATAMGRDMNFLFDRHLGGRVNQLEVLNDISIIPGEPFTALPEIVYLGMLEFFGVPGLLLFMLHLAVPVAILWLEGVPPLRLSAGSACLQGMGIYMIVACADGAFGFIPVMMVFWMIAGMGFWYAHQQARFVPRIPAGAGRPQPAPRPAFAAAGMMRAPAG